MLQWLKDARGISQEALDAYGVHENPKGEAVFPYVGAEKRRWFEGDERKFTFTKGFTPSLFGKESHYPTVFICEGETDTLRLWTELNKAEIQGVGVVGIAGIDTWLDSFGAEFDGADHIYVVLDNDADYKTAAKVDQTWMRMRKALGPKRTKRVYLPDGVKDLCDFFDSFDVEAFKLLADRAVTPDGMWHYKALDLSKTPSPPKWLVQDLLCMGDLVMMIGEPGVGKSWLSMSLAVAIAEGHESWLGRKLGAHGRVLYVDEENPEALVPHRLKKLGLTDKGAENVRYLHRQGVRLDKRPDLLLDEALDWEPELIVLDSLTRLHTKDENNAGEIAALFNDGINPLARDSGATTLVLHHVNKSESSSSFTRARGSGDLSASIDSGLDVRESDTVGGLNIAHYKSRWIGEGTVIRATIADTPEGDVRIIVNNRERSF